MTEYYKLSIATFFERCLVFGIIGLFLGIIIEKYFTRLSHKYPNNKLALGISQLLINILLLYIIEIKISEKFSDEWQDTTPGIFFVSIFFGVQAHLYDNLLERPSVSDTLKDLLSNKINVNKGNL